MKILQFVRSSPIEANAKVTVIFKMTVTWLQRAYIT